MAEAPPSRQLRDWLGFRAQALANGLYWLAYRVRLIEWKLHRG